jgi:hypothetical protein
MTVKVDESVQAIWLVMTDEGPWVLTVSKDENGQIRLRQYLNAIEKETKLVAERNLTDVLSKIRATVQRLMEKSETDKGWEAIRGIRSLDEYMDVLRALPGFKEKKRAP